MVGPLDHLVGEYFRGDLEGHNLNLQIMKVTGLFYMLQYW